MKFANFVYNILRGKVQSEFEMFLQYFATKLDHFTKFRMLFPAVLMNIPNSKVCLKGDGLLNSISVYRCEFFRST